jgi:hypothetical protein
MPASLRLVFTALLSGCVSAGLVLAVETDSLLRLVLAALAPLPLFASGLSAGSLSCVAAGLTGAVVVTVTMGSFDGAAYLAAAVVPSAVLARQAIRHAKTTAAGRTWYSGGNLLLWLAGLGLVGVLAMVGYFALFRSGLASEIASRSGLPGPAAAMAARIAPGLAVALWMAAIAVDGVLAEWLVARLGAAIRPPVDITRISLPLWVGPILMVAGLAGAILRHGTVGIVCLNSAIVLIVPFAFLGLAMIHAVAGRKPGGPILIAAAYIVLLGSPAVLGWRALLMFTLMLAGLGSVDQLLDFRDIRGLRSGMRKK